MKIIWVVRNCQWNTLHVPAEFHLSCKAKILKQSAEAATGVVLEKMFFKRFVNFTGKHLCGVSV